MTLKGKILISLPYVDSQNIHLNFKDIHFIDKIFREICLYPRLHNPPDNKLPEQPPLLTLSKQNRQKGNFVSKKLHTANVMQYPYMQVCKSTTVG